MATNNAVNTTLFGQTGTGEFVGADDAEMTNLTVNNINIDANTISSIDTNGFINLNPNGNGTVAINTNRDTRDWTLLLDNASVGTSAQTVLLMRSAAASDGEVRAVFQGNSDATTQWSCGQDYQYISGGFYIGRGTYPVPLNAGLAFKIDSSLNTTLYGQLNVGTYNITTNTISTVSGEINLTPASGQNININLDRSGTFSGLQVINSNATVGTSGSSIALFTAPGTNSPTRTFYCSNTDVATQWVSGQSMTTLSGAYFIGRTSDFLTTGLAMSIDTSLNATFTNQVNVPLTPTNTTSATSKQYVDNRASAKTTIAGTSQSAAVNTTYIALAAGQTTLTLPSTFAVGDEIALIGSTANTGGWIVQAAGGDTVRVNNATTSAGGTVTSAAVAGQTIYLMCDVANTSWVMTSTVSTTLTTA